MNTDSSVYRYPNGFVVLANGTAVLSDSKYSGGSVKTAGPVEIEVWRSTNGGASWTRVAVDNTVFTGVNFETSSTTTIAADASGGSGHRVLRGDDPGREQSCVHPALDRWWCDVVGGGSRSATRRRTAASRDRGEAGSGDFRITYMDNSTGSLERLVPRLRRRRHDVVGAAPDLRRHVGVSVQGGERLSRTYGDYDGIAIANAGKERDGLGAAGRQLLDGAWEHLVQPADVIGRDPRRRWSVDGSGEQSLSSLGSGSGWPRSGVPRTSTSDVIATSGGERTASRDGGSRVGRSSMPRTPRASGTWTSARSYGDAEAFLGDLARHAAIGRCRRSVGSKWGYTYVGGWRLDADAQEVKDLSVAALRRQIAESRRLLGDHLSLYQIHSATIESGVFDDRAVLDELRSLRDQASFLGFSTSGPQQADAIVRGLQERVDGEPLFSTVQSTWNVLEPSAGPALAEAHADRRGVLIKEAMANGRLAATDGPLGGVAGRLGTTPDRIALAAVHAQPWADVVLSGAVTVEQVRSNASAVERDASRRCARGDERARAASRALLGRTRRAALAMKRATETTFTKAEERSRR